jgi:MFS family permease
MVALLLVGWSPSFATMLVFRCLQGIGAALVLSCGAALVISLFGEERRSHALGIYAMMLAVGLMLGPLLGGALTSAWGWPSVFWFRIPIAVAALLLLRGVRGSPQRQAGDRFDVPGGVALVLGLVTMLLALNRMREFSAVWFALLSALAFVAFIFRESRAARPIIAVDVLNETGAILATAAAGAALGAPIGGRLAGRHISAQRLAIAGTAANGIGLLLLGAWTEQTPTILRIAALLVQGVGLGLFQLGYSDIVTAALPLRDRGVAGSLVLLTRTFGTVTSASVVLMVFEILSTTYGFLEGFQKTCQLAALLAFIAAALSAIFIAQVGDPNRCHIVVVRDCLRSSNLL